MLKNIINKLRKFDEISKILLFSKSIKFKRTSKVFIKTWEIFIDIYYKTKTMTINRKYYWVIEFKKNFENLNKRSRNFKTKFNENLKKIATIVILISYEQELFYFCFWLI